MKREEKDALLRTIADPGSGGTHGREEAKAKLEAGLAEEANQNFAQASEDINQAKKILGERFTELTTEIKSTRTDMNASGKEMAALTGALVRWTRVSVATVIIYTNLMAIYTVLTGILVWCQVSGCGPNSSSP